MDQKEEIEWTGKKILCPCDTFQWNPNDELEFFESFKWKLDYYYVGDFVKVKCSNDNEYKICKLLCFYQSHYPIHKDRPNRAYIQPYIKASKEPELGKANIEFDEQFELLEDYRTMQTFINLEDILGKCTVIAASPHDPVDFISKSNLNDGNFFFCRYKITDRLKGGRILPLRDVKGLSGGMKSPEKILKRKGDIENEFPNLNGSRSSRKANKTPKFLNNVPTGILTPSKVKRNLNTSFIDSPNMGEESPICLNYSIVESCPEDGSNLKLKLKLSEPKKQPLVILEKLQQDILEKLIIESPQKQPYELREKKVPAKISSVRRSSRNTNRVSYSEYTSPKKNRRFSIDDDAYSIKQKNYNDKKENTVVPEQGESSQRTPSIRNRKIKVESIFEEIVNQEDIEKTPSKRGRENEDSEEEINVTSFEGECTSPSKKSRVKKMEEIMTPSKLGLEKLRIKSPQVTPSKRNHKKKIETPIKVQNVLPARRLTRRSSANPNYFEDFDDVELLEPYTPSRRHTVKKTLAEESTPKKTPSTIKLLRNGLLTPTMKFRETSIAKDSTPLNVAKAKLHVSHVPKSLPCREKEFSDILAFVKGKLLDGCGGCIYISGVPGTGKTATVTEVIRQLEQMSDTRKLPKFQFISINGMRLTEPRQSYVEIYRQMTGKTVPWEQAQNLLNSKFTKAKSGKKEDAIVLLVDELDILCTKRQDVVYNLLDWPTKATAQLIVLTIANTMDLPERLLMGRVTSRLGLTRLTFQAYTHKQLQEIVMKRLVGTEAFKPDAVQLVARKVASVSGDARRALDICRRAVEIAEVEGPQTLVSMVHVNEALDSMIAQPKVQAIKQCSKLEQLLLQAVASEVERTGVEETTFADVYTMLKSLAAFDGFAMASITLSLAAISRLSASRILLTDQKTHDLNQRLILNVSVDDIYYALRREN